MQLGIDNNTKAPQFGMAVRFNNADARVFYTDAERFSVKEMKELCKLFTRNNGLKTDVFVSLDPDTGKLTAEVGQKVYENGRFTNALKILKKATKEAEKLHKREIELAIDKNDDFSRLVDSLIEY